MSGVRSAAATEAPSPVWAAQLFFASLIIPVNISLGPLLLMPHRFFLLVLFIPFFLKLFVFRQAGPIIAADWLLFGSTLWAGVAVFVNHPQVDTIEAAGIHIVEFFGAYLVARVAIRSEADFRRVVQTIFLVLMVLLPFAAAESILKRPFYLDLVPGSFGPIYGMGERWGMRRAQTAFSHPILFGVFVSTAFGLCYYALRPRSLRFIGVPAAVLATVFSLSVGALLSIVVQSVFIGWETVMKFMKARWRLFLAGSIVGYVVIDLLSNRSPFHVLVTYGTFSTGSAYNRIQIWEFGTANVWGSPIFGIGFNDWARPSWMGSSVDNFWLLLAMRYGLPAIIMIIIGLVLILRQVSRAELTREEDKLARAGYLVAFGGLAIAGGTVHYWHSMMAFAMFIFGSGVWAATGGGITGTGQAPDPDGPRERVSAYTRQTEWGKPIGRGGGGDVPRKGPLRTRPLPSARARPAPRDRVPTRRVP